MKKNILQVAFFVCFSCASTHAEDAKKIIDQMTNQNKGFKSEYGEMEMTLFLAGGEQTQRKMIGKIIETSQGGRKALTFFEWPADVKGTRSLVWNMPGEEPKQWIYLPSLKKVKRIVASGLTSSFMGSEFTYEDFGGQNPDDFSYTLSKTEKAADGSTIHHIHQKPKKQSGSYSKIQMALSTLYWGPITVEYFDKKNELLKRAQFENYKKFDQWWRPESITMENIQTGKKTVIAWRTRKLNQPFKEKEFESERIGQN